MRIENEHTGFIIGLHEFFDNDTGKVAFTSACTGNDGKMGAHQVLHGEHNGHCLGRTGQQRTDARGTILSCSPAAKNGSQHLIIGQENLFARLWRNPGIDERAGSMFVVTHDSDM